MKKSRDRFIRSYHDAGFFSIWSELRIEIEGVGTALLHHMPYAGDSQTSNRYEEWRPKRGNEVLQIHGHIHEKWKVRPGMINAGVDVWDYVPVSLEQIKSVYIPPEGGTVSP
jgi:calcineurin-like phosphoesterase family protein